VLKIHKSAWLLVLLSAALQILVFPLPNLYMLGWVAVAPLLIGLLRGRQPDTLQLQGRIKLRPATPWQAFLLAYACGILWYAGTCYWIYSTMRQYGGVSAPLGVLILILFSMYLALYHGVFGLVISLLARQSSSDRPALLLAPAAWVALELARTQITGFPWDLLGISQVDNASLARIATTTGVYGISFEIMVVNVALAAAFLVRREKRRMLLLAALGAIVVLQSARWIELPPSPTDHTALLIQQNIPVLDNADWTREYFDDTLQDLSSISLTAELQNSTVQNRLAASLQRPSLIVWPESPAPFYTTDPIFRGAVTKLAREAQTWIVVGSLGTGRIGQPVSGGADQIFNSASLISPGGDWVARYDKVHLVPFGEYVPFRRLFSFAAGLTSQVGDFSHGTSREPLNAGGTKVGVFICYESIFPGEVRQLAANGAQVLVNISNDGWYGDSGAYAQHLKQARMRAIENGRWLLRDTNTGVTSSIDPYGRVVASAPRKIRAVLRAPYALSNVTTFYTVHGDWFAWLCAIISVVALLTRLPISKKAETKS
jgi:apolipoprotein N-acyltransferase